MPNSVLQVSLVIPMKNEEDSLAELIKSIKLQTSQPDEIVLVDGGSTDKTVELAHKLTGNDERFQIIEAGNATPGRGRNIGVENARSEWIAFTDAGIRLEPNWLEELKKVTEADSSVDVVYGSYEAEKKSFFEKCFALAYLTPKIKKNGEWWRGAIIPSSLMKRSVWGKVGGFPDLRAAEDLIFMENIAKQNFRIGYAPRARIWWKPTPDIFSMFKKFALYSKHNIWAKRQKHWHYGLAKQYIVIIPFILLTLLHSWLWLLVVLLWISARTVKNIRLRCENRESWWLINPIQFVGVSFIIIVIDIATFSGWIQAVLQSPEKS